jgi:hypothetical protein
MAVTLIKVVNGIPALTDGLENKQAVKCPLCEQTYRLSYSDSEWNRVKDWLGIAERAIRDDHKLRHQALSFGLKWRPLRRR